MLDLPRVLPFFRQVIQGCLKHLLVDKEGVEGFLDRAVRQRPFFAAAPEIDEVTQLVLGIRGHTVTHGIEHVALDLSRLAFEVVDEVLFRKPVIVRFTPGRLLKTHQSIVIQRTAQMSLHGLVERHLLQRRTRVCVCSDQGIRVRIDEHSNGQNLHAEQDLRRRFVLPIKNMHGALPALAAQPRQWHMKLRTLLKELLDQL